MATKISWCDETINPVVGCSKVSEGCRNCYAEDMARRLAHMGLARYQRVLTGWTEHGDEIMKYGGWNGATAFVSSELDKPSRWKKPRSIFISSMGDLFHESVPYEWIDAVMVMVGKARQHTFIMLTKRPERMKEYFADRFAAGFTPREGFTAIPLPNLVLGVSAEDQATADKRIRTLLQIPAAKRFVSIEPMLGEIDLYRGGWSFLYSLKPPPGNKTGWKRGLDGVIVGGESGSKGRRLDPLWVMKVRDQCEASGVPFMFKQWGEWLPCFDSTASTAVHEFPGGERVHRVGKKVGGYLLDGKTHLVLPWDKLVRCTP